VKWKRKETDNYNEEEEDEVKTNGKEEETKKRTLAKRSTE